MRASWSPAARRRPSRLRSPRCRKSTRVIGNEEKFDAQVWASDARVAVADIMAAKAMRAARHRPHRTPHPRIRAGAERLRPSLHLLHHSVRPRQFALAADHRRAGAGAALRRQRLPRGRADRCRHHELWPGPAGRTAPRRAGQSCAQGISRAGAAAPVVDRLGRSRSRPARCARRRAAADAASASVAAARRRSDPQAHEAAPFARRRDSLLRRRAPAAPRRRAQRRHHRRLSDRDRSTCSRARSISSTNAG